MGIMPVDRELKWQRVFRRFGLPGEMASKEEVSTERGDSAQNKEDPGRSDAAAKKQGKKSSSR